MGRYLLILTIAFILYWFLKGTLRRLFAPPKRKGRPRTSGAQRRERRERVEEGRRRTPGIDYSKVKDADYRDL